MMIMQKHEFLSERKEEVTEIFERIVNASQESVETTGSYVGDFDFDRSTARCVAIKALERVKALYVDSGWDFDYSFSQDTTSCSIIS
ncbi:hypothetical protein L4D76_23885 [Photobacterium sagamiensis]|uniref:hypothetical protein n=1 Tax=Photobacterium sagamiensis TaxID=2910241 RepID=UPI003D0BFC99